MKTRLTHPKYWPSWFVVGLFRAIGLLPFPLLWTLGMGLGRLTGRLAGSRRRVALQNLEICLPDLTPRERERIASLHFGYLGVAVFTQGVVWGASRRRFQRLVRMPRWERIEEIRSQGENVIFMVPHFIGLELGGVALGAALSCGTYMYQKIRNPVLDAQMNHSRARFGGLAVERSDDLRSVVRQIRKGIPFIYLPDQDAGRRRGIFVPFCGIPAATVPVLGRFARMGHAVVIPTYARYLPWGRGLELIFDDPLDSFPSGDDAADTARMNQVIEERVRSMPAQYFWVHRRFKTRPPGEPSLYPPKRRRARGRRR